MALSKIDSDAWVVVALMWKRNAKTQEAAN